MCMCECVCSVHVTVCVRLCSLPLQGRHHWTGPTLLQGDLILTQLLHLPRPESEQAGIVGSGPPEVKGGPSRPLPSFLSCFQSLDLPAASGGGPALTPRPFHRIPRSPKSRAHASLLGGWPSFGGGGVLLQPRPPGPGQDCEAAWTRSLSLGGRVPCRPSAAHRRASTWPAERRQGGMGALVQVQL